jgi:hypothetical protein
MSQPPLPTTWDAEVYPLGQSGALGSDQWLEWGQANPGFTPLTVSFVSGLAVKYLWFPDPQGQMSFYAGDSATGTPFYVTPGNVAEGVSIPNDAPVVTIVGPATSFFFYASSYGFAPFAAGTPPALDITTVAPIINEGTPQVPIIALQTPLAVIYGGSGTPDPSLISGQYINITGAWPNQTISALQAAGGVQSVSVNAPIVESGTAQNPVIGLETPLPQNYGGTATANPWAKGGTGIDVNGVSGVDDNSFQWVINNDGVLSINPSSLGPITGAVKLNSAGGTVAITNPGGGEIINLEVVAAVAYAKEMDLTTGGPNSASLSLGPLPSGSWLLEAYVFGLEAPETTGTDGATLTLSTGDFDGWTQNQYTRALGVAAIITSSGSSSPSATIAYTTGVGVNTNASSAFFVFKATLIA